jgi:hypothetical protein
LKGCALLSRGLERQEFAIMPRQAAQDGLDKFLRYRATRWAAGMKLLRVWVPDPAAPGFREEAWRQAASLRGAQEQQEALDFIEATGDWSE